MEISQIKEIGIVTDKWTTLENLCRIINFKSDSQVFISPKTSQFYFDSKSNLLFIRKTNGKVTNYYGKLNERNVVVEHNLKEYQIRLVDGGIEDPEIGVYHEVVDLEDISLINV